MSGSYQTRSQTCLSISTLQEDDTIPNCSDCPKTCGLGLCPKIVTWFIKAMALIQNDIKITSTNKLVWWDSYQRDDIGKI